MTTRVVSHGHFVSPSVQRHEIESENVMSCHSISWPHMVLFQITMAERAIAGYRVRLRMLDLCRLARFERRFDAPPHHASVR